MHKIHITTLILMLSIVCCNAQTSLLKLSFKKGKTTVIRNVVDMKGEELLLPKDVTLKFEKGGCLKNGKIVAANTSIEGYKQGIFETVNIAGQWNVEYISTDMFTDISSVNSLQNVFALASERVDNVITVPKGNYEVVASHNGSTILNIPSNTEVIINGTITMRPNSFANYNIVELKGENIQLHGKGEIVGDKHSHIGTKGEWGMGVMVTGGIKIDIYDLTIKNCWGDCIYIGKESTNVNISNCTLDHGRRQGISITSAGSVLIENCMISNVGGTAPEYAIDIEPNSNNSVEDVQIVNVSIHNCCGGITSRGNSKNASINNVILDNCKVTGSLKYYPYRFRHQAKLTMKNCVVDVDIKPSILLQHVKNVVAYGNHIEGSNTPFRIQKCDHVTIQK